MATVTPLTQFRLTYPPDFERFWSAYPSSRRLGKRAAYKKWVKLRPTEEETNVIVASVEMHRQTAQWRRDGGQFVPLPTTYLNQCRWEDEVPVDRSIARF